MSGNGPADCGVTSWVWADEYVLESIADVRPRGYVLMACYLGLCRLANESRTRSGFEVGIPSLAAAMGASDKKAARAALWRLHHLGYVRVEPRKTARDENLPHLVSLIEGGSHNGSTPAERLPGDATVGRDTTEGESRNGSRVGRATGAGSVAQREQGRSRNGSRSEEREEEHLEVQEERELPLSPRHAERAEPTTLDLSKLQKNGQLAEGNGDFVFGGEVVASGGQFDTALIRFGRSALGLKTDARHVPEAVRDILCRPSARGKPVDVGEVLSLVRQLSNSDKMRARVES